MPRRAALAQVSTSDDPIELLQQAEVLRRRAEQSFGEYALEAGRLLLLAKKKIPHGSWLNFLEAETGYSSRTAESYMSARRRWDKMPEAERAGVLEQAFSRSVLVLAQSPRQVVAREALPAPVGDLLDSEKGNRRGRTNGHTNGTPTDIDALLTGRSSDTTALIDASVTFHPEVRESPDDVHEATPLDDILDGPQRVYPETTSVLTEEALTSEERQMFEEAIAQMEILERQNRTLQAELVEAQSQRNPNQMRGWDFVQSLYQYLRADEPARTPESLARRAQNVEGGREIVSYLEQFFAATRNHLSALA